MSFTQEEIEEFKVEAIELIDLAETSLLKTGKEPFQEIYQVVFRCLHNLKGASGMMEMDDLQKHIHEVETIFTKNKDKESIPQSTVDFMLVALDAARNILSGQSIEFCYERTATDGAESGLVSETVEEQSNSDQVEKHSLDEALGEFLLECNEIVDRISTSLDKLERKGYEKDLVDGIYRDIHSLKGAAFLFDFKKIGDLAHAIETFMEPLRDQSLEIPRATFDSFYKALEIIEEQADLIRRKKNNPDADKRAEEMCSKFLNLDGVSLNDSEELVSESNDEKPISVPDQTAKNTESVTAEVLTPTVQEKDVAASSVRVSVQLLDKLMALMGEMVLVRNQVLQYSNDSDDLDFHNLSKRLNVVTSEIQEEMMKTRMQPIGNVVNKFNRVVRDLSRSLGKDIQLHISGAETELDKSLLEAIKDPLTHIVRNACDHGIENPSDRASLGKNKQGSISLRAFHEGGQVVVEVKDDGRGLNRERIIHKAIEKNLLSQQNAERLSDSEIYNLILNPGFSTAEKVTSVSGRGVGMDVVATNIESIGGTIDIDSHEGQGSVFTIKVPLTLAIVPALIVNCAKSKFAIPQVKLLELVRVEQNTENKIEILQGTPVYRLRGEILPLIDLNNVLGSQDSEAVDFDKNEIVNIAVVQADNQCFGLIVDSVRDTADIVVKPLNRLLKSLQVYSGATVLGDGSVALILDVQGIAKVMDIRAATDAQADYNEDSLDKRILNADMQDYLLVSLNSPTKHAIVLNYVHRLEEFSKKDIEISGNQRVVRYRGNILPLVDCNEILSLGEKSSDESDTFSVIVVERAGKLFGVEVNSILDTLVTPLETQSPVEKQDGIVGHLNLEEELVVVLDPFELISLAFPKFENSESLSVPLNSLLEVREKEMQIEKINELVKNAKILVVEDTAFFRKIIKSTLEKTGHQVVVANDGLEAESLLKDLDQPFDLIVSDIEMPRMNGFDLAQSVRENPIHQKTPLLALSSKCDRQHKERGREAGFNHYMEKFKPDDLNQKIFELLKERKGAA